MRFVKYPVCLHFLELLQHESFRKEMVNGHVSAKVCLVTITKPNFDSSLLQSAKFLDDQTILSWQHYTRKRMRLLEGSVATQQASAQVRLKTQMRKW